MTWRMRLGVRESDDRSDTSSTSVTCVTSSVDTEKGESPKLVFDPNHPIVVRARTVLNQAGVRTILLDGVITIGLWSDLDGQEIREAMRTLGHAGMSIQYLDGGGIPNEHKLRRVEGEPVPLNVLAEMERYPANPWKVRDRMLGEMGWKVRRK